MKNQLKEPKEKLKGGSGKPLVVQKKPRASLGKSIENMDTSRNRLTPTTKKSQLG